jgi:hypothetical protein
MQNEHLRPINDFFCDAAGEHWIPIVKKLHKPIEVGERLVMLGVFHGREFRE